MATDIQNSHMHSEGVPSTKMTAREWMVTKANENQTRMPLKSRFSFSTRFREALVQSRCLSRGISELSKAFVRPWSSFVLGLNFGCLAQNHALACDWPEVIKVYLFRVRRVLL